MTFLFCNKTIIMKKLWLFSVLSLGLIFVAGCTVGTQQNAWSDDVMWVYEAWDWEMTCVLTYTSELEEGTSTIYVKGKMMKQETTATIEWEEYNISTLARDGKMYMWWDMYGEMAGFSMTYEINVAEELSSFQNLDDGTTINCTKGVKKSSVFDLPKDINFESMDSLNSLIDLDVEWDDEINLLDETEEVVDEIAEEAENVEEVVEETAEEVEEVDEEVVEEVTD